MATKKKSDEAPASTKTDPTQDAFRRSEEDIAAAVAEEAKEAKEAKQEKSDD